MRSHRADTTVSGDGSVTVRGVPFPEGVEVEVTIRARRSDAPEDAPPLRGSVLRYDDPFAPATDAEDWDAARASA